jgi:ABC-type uncharacterized transport system auxiliary subunit
MKVFYLKSLVAIALAATLTSCEKNAENHEIVSETNASSTAEVIYPLSGTDISNNILPKKKLARATLTKGYLYPKIKVKLIDTVCIEYLQSTTKLDFSYLKEGAFVNKIGNSEFRITADIESNASGFARLSNGPTGWWAHWNYSPYTESEHPAVLFARSRKGNVVRGVSGINLSFNKTVKTFGFEIAPSSVGKQVEVSVKFKDSQTYRAQTLFEVEQTISSPSGARLIAVKSEVPFDFIMIQLKDIPYYEGGFAISNIRYELPK